ncbi:MAG: ABC transporter ATP-binding protein [Firmicutes bacterium]|nr:ABC transporter ATP-binding protein [Bacillota bacterium]
MLAIQTKNLTKTYKGHGGCRDISLAVPKGSVFGLLGHNGAGKSSLVKVLVGLLHPTSGEATILGKTLNDTYVRKKVGYLPENFKYHDWLSGEDLLKFHGSLYGMSRTDIADRIPKVLEYVGLQNHAHKRVGGYSKGMQQRIGIGCALINNPDLLFLDEPTSALDPIGRKVVRDLIMELKGQGKTVFINSHLLGELETICDQIAIIKDSQMIYQGNWREISAAGYQVKVIVSGSESDIDGLQQEKFTLISQNNELQGRKELVFACEDDRQVPNIVKYLVQSGLEIYQVKPETASLEKLFLHYMNDGTGLKEGSNYVYNS